MRRSFFLFILSVLTFACGSFPDRVTDPDAPVHHLVILHTNDTHGHPVRFSYNGAPDVGGLPARATLIKQIKAHNKNVLVLDAGDFNTGRIESNAFNAEPDIEGYNAIGYDALTIGNHEFDNSQAVLIQQMSLARFPFLTANIRTTSGKPIAPAYAVKGFDDFTVAIFGLTTTETALVANPENIQNLQFLDEVAVARELVPELNKQADVVIALTHLGIYDSLEQGSKRLAAEVAEIDLIVDGHTHTRLDAPIIVRNGDEPDHKTIIVQAWKWGLVLGRTDLWVQNGQVIDYDFEAIPINLTGEEKNLDGKTTYRSEGPEIAEDEELAALLAPYVERVHATTDRVIGIVEDTFFNDEVRRQETALGDLVADSMMWVAAKQHVDFALQNSGGIRAAMQHGPLTVGAVNDVLPFDNTVVVLTLRGSDVEDLFAYCATMWNTGGFLQVSSGVALTLNRDTCVCEDVRIQGRPIDPLRTYTIAVNSYLAEGGDGYAMFLRALDKYDLALMQRDAFINYIEALGGQIRPEKHDRIRIVGEETKQTNVEHRTPNIEHRMKKQMSPTPAYGRTPDS